MVVLSLFAELISNDRPLIVHYEGTNYFPLVKDYPETTFGGDFLTTTDYLDPFIRERLSQDGNWAVFALNHYGPKTLNYFAEAAQPVAADARELAGYRRPRARSAGAADLRLSRQRVVCAGADA